MTIPFTAILVDARNINQLLPQIIAELQAAPFVGIDLETHDEDRHEGLNRAMKVDQEGKKSAASRLVFDIRRTTICGFSVYADGADHAYYVNLAHADVDNRIPWPLARQILDAKAEDAYWISHNAPFEITMLKMSLGYDLGEKVICSMQLAVTAYNDDEYPVDKFMEPGLGGIQKLFPAIAREFTGYQPGAELTAEQEELLMKVIAKESHAEHSYLGYVKSMAYGYGLKQAVKSWFGYQMQTFEETLGDKVHMGQLTGEEVVAYGADDAYWAVQLYHKLMDYLLQHNPAVVKTFFEQENPMIHVYAEVWQGGLRLAKDNVLLAQAEERKHAAEALRTMKRAVQALLPFPQAPHEKLLKYDTKWYPKNYAKYRQAITAWAKLPDSPDDFTQCAQVRSPVSVAWAVDIGKPEPKGVNLGHYMPMRTLLYDLCGVSFMLSEGKVQSDSESRDVMRERWVKKEGRQEVLDVLDAYKTLAGIDQRMKLYITPYLNLVDPDTNCVYPVLSSKLNTRRMACSSPNGQQLAKYGDSGYVRSFFLADRDDHVLVSADWSAVELVIIGEFSNDTGFREAYGQRPHKDLHGKAVRGLLKMSLEEYLALPNKSELRRDVGKKANFNYWYSGALGTVGDHLGWSSEQMWEAVENYRATFPEAEAWRLDTISQAREQGYVELPDHHRRVRFEATYTWANVMRQKFATAGLPQLVAFGELVIKKLQTRAGNQAVNAQVQGLCAALAKRKILTMRRLLQGGKYDARFYLAIHDELVFSVHKDQAVAFMEELYQVMIEPDGLFTHMQLDSSVAVGRNFQLWDKDGVARHGQIELMELNKGLPCVGEDRWGQKATLEERQQVVDFLFSEVA